MICTVSVVVVVTLLAEDDHSRKLICFGLASEMRKNSVMLDHLKD